jgi:hypothetical protein
MTGQAERLAQLRERAQSDYPESWKPSEQEPMIAGEYVRLEHGHTSYGPKEIVILRTEDGRERSVWVLNEVLGNQLRRVRPRAGDLLCIHWRGKRRSTGGNEYDDYRVVVDRGENGDEWSGAPAAAASDEELNGRSLEHLPAGDQQAALDEDRPPF